MTAQNLRFMKPEILTWLEDIQRSIEEIFDFLPEKRDYFEFERDLKTQKAVERNLEILISENGGKLLGLLISKLIKNIF